jgi:glycosyltransferase involved in cell wall biosynthesis
MTHDLDHICVCICTYLRPALLLRLLEKLEDQVTRGSFTFSAVVVDNDVHRSAQAVVDGFKGRSGLAVEYYVEPVRNISLARNKAVAMSRGKYLAFIDDDEFPERTWLCLLRDTCLRTGGECVLGPVEPFYETRPPAWVVKGRLCEREHFETGTVIRRTEHTRTGNVLLLREVCLEKEGPFEPSLGRSGGEDYEFFRWMLNRGYTITWCNEAPVYESVPPERMRRSYFLKRGLLRGGLNAREGKVISGRTLRSLVAVGLYCAALPLLAFLGQHLVMKYLIKSCDHAGKLLGLCGIELVKERTF